MPALYITLALLLTLLQICPAVFAQDRRATVSESTTAPPRAERGRRVALLIGNSSYVKLKRLANPRNDVRLMQDTLQQLGFTVYGGTEAGLDRTAGDMSALLEEFGAHARGAEMAIIYFAGHGLVTKASNEQFLVGIDASGIETRLKKEAVSLNEVLDTVRRNPASNNFVFLDACRETARGGGMRSISPTSDAPNTVVLYATAADDVAADGNGNNSPFTAALATEIKAPGKEWTAIQRAVVKKVKEAPDSRGQEPKPYGSFASEVYFTVTVEPGPQAVAMAQATQAERAWDEVKTSNNISELE